MPEHCNRDAAVKHSDLDRAFDISNLKPKLDAMELVRSDLTRESIEVPGVVVIGDQSAGKSSVLESISGVNFPRGENTCTRRPCVLRMECEPSLRGDAYAYVSNEADVKKTGRRVGLEKIGPEIDRLTVDHTGTGANMIIIPAPIHVKGVRKCGPTLTLIDLPGITHWLNGPQQSNIHDVIVNMIKKYIKNEQMVILAVVSATSDFGNSEALKLAKEVDPQQIRTIGVVTKIDTIQQDSDIVMKLRAERDSDVKLNLGWIAVRCRTPTEVKEGLGPEDLRKKEQEFVQSHPLLVGLENKFWGTHTLVERVVEIQSETVDKWIPEVKAEIVDRLLVLEKKVKEIGEACDDDGKKRDTYMKLTTDLTTAIEACVRGEYRGRICADKQRHITPRLFEFYREFESDVKKTTPDFLSKEYFQLVAEQDSENRGGCLPNFLSDPVFTTLFVQEFEKVMPVATAKLLTNIREYLLKVLKQFVSEVMAGFPRLETSIKSDVESIVEDAYEVTDNMLGFMFTSETAFTTTLDEANYEKIVDTMESIVKTGKSATDAEWPGKTLGISVQQVLGLQTVHEQNPRAFKIQCSLAAYSGLVHHQLFDRVVKMSRFFIVTQMLEALKAELRAKDMDFITANTIQDPQVVMKRERLVKSIERLDKCRRTLDGVQASRRTKPTAFLNLLCQNRIEAEHDDINSPPYKKRKLDTAENA